jgi:hypothetical protein
MTPAAEARFIELWQQGASYKALAAAFGCPLGTVASWAAALEAAGKIQRRPRGGAYPSRRAEARSENAPAPVQRPVQKIDTGAVQTFDTGPVQRLDRLEDEVQGLRQLVQAVIERLDHPPVQTPVQITALPPLSQGQGRALEPVDSRRHQGPHQRPGRRAGPVGQRAGAGDPLAGAGRPASLDALADPQGYLPSNGLRKYSWTKFLA